jgi:hypothetical protein
MLIISAKGAQLEQLGSYSFSIVFREADPPLGRDFGGDPRRRPLVTLRIVR